MTIGQIDSSRLKRDSRKKIRTATDIDYGKEFVEKTRKIATK